MVTKYISEHEWHFGDHKECHSFLFRKCHISGESLFNKKAIRIRYYDYSGMYEDYWVSKGMYLFLVLQYGIKQTQEQE